MPLQSFSQRADLPRGVRRTAQVVRRQSHGIPCVVQQSVLVTCQPKHRYQGWLQFLQLIDAQTDPALDLHIIADNYATHKHSKVKAWLKKHQQFHMHFIPTSSSWLNVIERWFREITDKRIRRGTFKNVEQLIAAIQEFIEQHNSSPEPFVWTAKA